MGLNGRTLGRHRAGSDHHAAISALERSVHAASIDVVDRLARVLGVEAADLFRTLPRQATAEDQRQADTSLPDDKEPE